MSPLVHIKESKQFELDLSLIENYLVMCQT